MDACLRVKSGEKTGFRASRFVGVFEVECAPKSVGNILPVKDVVDQKSKGDILEKLPCSQTVSRGQITDKITVKFGR